MHRPTLRWVPLLLLCWSCAFGTGVPEDVDPANLPEIATWDDHAESLFALYCTDCHGPVRAIEGLDFSEAASAACAWGEVREQLDKGHPPGSAPHPNLWEEAVLYRWADGGFALGLDASGAPIYDALVCRGGGDDD